MRFRMLGPLRAARVVRRAAGAARARDDATACCAKSSSAATASASSSRRPCCRDDRRCVTRGCANSAKRRWASVAAGRRSRSSASRSNTRRCRPTTRSRWPPATRSPRRAAVRSRSGRGAPCIGSAGMPILVQEVFLPALLRAQADGGRRATCRARGDSMTVRIAALPFAVPQPVRRDPGQPASRFPVHRIYCVGRNYAAHVREMGADPEREPPCFFTKPADAVVPNGAAGAVSRRARRTCITRSNSSSRSASGGRNIAPAAALDHVFGYAVGNDLTRRDLQAAAKASGLPWDVAKGFDRSAPIAAIRPVGRRRPRRRAGASGSRSTARRGRTPTSPR